MTFWWVDDPKPLPEPISWLSLFESYRMIVLNSTTLQTIDGCTLGIGNLGGRKWTFWQFAIVSTAHILDRWKCSIQWRVSLKTPRDRWSAQGARSLRRCRAWNQTFRSGCLGASGWGWDTIPLKWFTRYHHNQTSNPVVKQRYLVRTQVQSFKKWCQCFSPIRGGNLECQNHESPKS